MRSGKSTKGGVLSPRSGFFLRHKLLIGSSRRASRALFINCTLKRSPEVSNTQGLMDISMEIMRRNGVEVEGIRAIDHEIATGVWPDMTEHGWALDEWPAIFQRVMAADILVIGTSIWLGEKSSVATQVIERLYGNSHLLNPEYRV
jgi:multimeric flavodoxin WrbA